jgi:hypothetical protein
MSYQVPQNIRAILEPLAEAVFPLGIWSAQKNSPKYDQFIPALSSVPWRSGGATSTLTTAGLKPVSFLELLVDNDAANDALASRWRLIKADPSKFFQSRSGQAMADWRAGRNNLSPSAMFSPFEPDSNNFAVFFTLPDKSRSPVSRQEFYEACWEPLSAAFQSTQPDSPDKWGAFAMKLWNDQFVVEWPSTNPVASSIFTNQFTTDVLNGCLNQKNTAIASDDPILQRAVLIEVGENRTPNNRYTPQQAAQAIDTFVKTIERGSA